MASLASSNFKKSATSNYYNELFDLYALAKNWPAISLSKEKLNLGGGASWDPLMNIVACKTLMGQEINLPIDGVKLTCQ